MAESPSRDKLVASIIGLVIGVLIGIWCAGNVLFLVQNSDRAINPQGRTVFIVFVIFQGIASLLLIVCGIVGVSRSRRNSK